MTEIAQVKPLGQCGLGSAQGLAKSSSRRLASAVSAISSSLTNPHHIVLALLVIYSIIRNLAAASAAPLWLDEILTWTVSSQRNWARIIKMLMEGVDGQPPLYYLVEHASMNLVHVRELGLRLPSVFAFPCTLICVFLFARRRGGDFAGILAGAFLFSTAIFRWYAAEARPYSLFVACIAVALLCYQRAGNRFYAIGMAAVLGMAQAFHHYAFFSIAPFAVAEGIYFLRGGRFRWWVWGALACPIIPIALEWRIISNFKTMYAAHFWSQYGFQDLAGTYGSFLGNNVFLGVGTAAMCVGIVLALCLQSRNSDRTKIDADSWSEGALLLMFLLLPIITLLGTQILHAKMVGRYVLPTILAMAISIGRIPAVSKSLLVLVLVTFGVFGAGCELIFWKTLDFKAAERFSLADEALVRDAARPDLPVAMDDALLFVPLSLYGSPEYRGRLVYLVDLEKAVAYSGSDTADRTLTRLRPYLTAAMPDYSEFVDAHREFLLVTREPRLSFDWLSRFLPAVSSVALIRSSDNRKLYYVRMGPRRAEMDNSVGQSH